MALDLAGRLRKFSPRTRKILRWLGYPSFYAFCLLIFAKLTFPYDRLKQRIEAGFNAAQTGTDASRLEIEEMSSYWIRGIEADNIRLISAAPAPAPAPDAESKPPPPKVTTIEHAYATISILRLLFGGIGVSFGADAFGGEVSGSYSGSDAYRALDFEASELNVGDVPFLVDTVGLPLGGQLAGTLEFDLPETELAKSNGTVEFTIANLTVGDGKAKIRNTIALPQLNAGQLELRARATDGKLDIETFRVQGPDLELSAGGSIRLRDPMDASLADMTLTFKFTDAYKNKSDVTRGLFGSPGSSIPGAFDLDPQIRTAKQPDGSYQWRITGPLLRMNFTPAGSSQPGLPGAPSRRRAPRPRR